MNIYETTWIDVAVHYLKNPLLVAMVLVNLIVFFVIIKVVVGMIKERRKNVRRHKGKFLYN